jgi:gliding motility-associated lipoprotein GldH
LPVSGKYTVKLRHGMREDVLKGIHDVGFRIEKVE